MSFREKVDQHIEETLMEGVLPDVDDVLEMEVPNQKPGPQKSGDEGGPKSSPAKNFPWEGNTWSAKFFGGASRGGENHTSPADGFSKQNRSYPPAKFNHAAKLREEAIQAVLADLEAMQDDE